VTGVPPDQVLTLLADEYRLDGELTRLPGENENYLVTTPRGTRYVVKLIDDEHAEDVLDLEQVAAETIAASGAGIGVPVIVSTRRGSPEIRWSREDGVPIRMRVLAHVPGVPWGSAGPPNAQRRARVGRCIARIAYALSPLTHPAAHRTHQWDLTAVAAHRPKTALLSDPARRRMVDEALTLYVATAVPRLAGLPRSVIHGDLNDENLLVTGDEVTGLLDFGDCLYNPTVCDLAIALTYLTFDEPDPLAAAAEIVGAYHGVRPLSLAELEVLFPLICGRLANSLLIAAERREVDPRRDAWFVTEPLAWRALERFLSTDPAAATAWLMEDTALTPPPNPYAPRRELLEKRQQRFSAALSLSYHDPLRFVRGRGQFLFDGRGWPYVDFYNNVAHVGHAHPAVVAAGERQMARLNTNTRYLYDELVAYADRLCATLPPALECCFFVNSGSEANELALRLARTHTGREDVVVLEHAYHGHTSTLIDVSPYKFLGKGGPGRPKPWVHVAPMPDGYRGPHRGSGREAGVAYGNEVGRVVAAAGRPIAAFLAETLPSVGGQILPPEEYFETAFRHVRTAGGVCILDEVQVGFGRVGTHFWAFQRQGVVPDIVVLGKPIGNGHPIGAVVTTRAIADSFAATGMEFFSTFGGNPVSCAIGMAVLDVIRDEGLQQHALELGALLLDGLQDLMSAHPLIGDVRGAGLFIGIELVKDRDTREPATAEAAALINALRDRRLLVGTDGPFENVVKIKGPLVVTRDDATMFVAAVDAVLRAIP